MKKILLITILFLLVLINNNYSQVVSSSSKQQPTTVKPEELAGSSFNGDVNLFTGTYGASYTVGSVATPGGLKYDVTIVYSSSLSAGDNVPVASGIPYGDGWGVQVPTISVSAVDYKKYSDQTLINRANSPNTIDESKFDANESSMWFAPMINIPGIASGRAVFKHLDPITNAPVFVLRAFEDQYIEILYYLNTWEVFLPDGTSYYFGAGSLSYSKGHNRRLQDESYDNPYPVDPRNYTPQEILDAENNVKPKAERLEWHCSRIGNRNMPNQFIVFNYEGFGKFNFFKEFSYDYMPKISKAFLHDATAFLAGGVPNLNVTSDIFLKSVISSTYDSEVGRVELEYGSESYGESMLDPSMPGVQRLDSLYNYKTVYSANFSNWKRYMHAKHPNFSALYYIPSLTNPFVNHEGNYVRKNAMDSYSNSNMVAFNHSFLESPRLFNTGSNTPLICGEIYEIKTKIQAGSESVNGFANVDINIATGKFNGSSGSNANSGIPGPDNTELIDANAKDNNYTNESIFTTFGNAVKWNPAAAPSSLGTIGTLVNTSNYFTMPNIPQEYDGITIQVGPANSDNFFNMTPKEILGHTRGINGNRSAYRSYWRENQASNNPHPIWQEFPSLKQFYEPVPHNFGIGLPWQMMKPMAQRILGDGDIPDVNSKLFEFWWYDQRYNAQPYNNVPTLLNEHVKLSDVELVRYSKNPYMLQSVKTYKVNGELSSGPNGNSGKILVNRFDFDYEHKASNVLDNALYHVGDLPIINYSRWSNIYLLKSVKNIPVNSSQELSNTIPATFEDAPTIHFEYEPYPPGTVIYEYFTGEGSLRTNNTVFPLKKIISHLGKVTEISYYPFDDITHVSIVSRYKKAPPITTQGTALPRTLLESRNFAVQINVPVQSITITDPTSSSQKKWNYEYSSSTTKHGKTIPFNYYAATPSIYTSSFNGQTGFNLVTVTEPEINGLRPFSKYYHFDSDGLGIFGENLLFGKLKKVESFNGAGIKLSEKEIIYDVKKAFVNGVNRSDWSGDYHYDYESFDNPSYVYQPLIPSGMHGHGIISHPSTFLETEVPGFGDDSYFIKKIKEIDREFETTTCNIPDNDGSLDPSQGGEDQRPASNPPSDYPITNIQSKEGDGTLINSINTSKLGKNFDTELIAASPLSDNVLSALLDKRPYYKEKTYSTVLAAQPVLSDAILSKLLILPSNMRDNIVRQAILAQQYSLSSAILRQLIAAQPQVEPSIIENALKQYNDLPEDIILSIINRNPKYTPELIASVLLAQVELSEQVHDLLLDKKYLPNELIKNIFVNGATYPTENSLITMINRKPDISVAVVQEVLLASPYQHTATVMASLSAKFNSDPIVGLVQEHNTSLPSWTTYCGNNLTTTTLSIEQITEYEYWDANEKGETTSEGFRKLLDVSDATVHLMYEPSWQLYKTKTYSPQLPGAFTEKEYFYYYDLKNKYTRRDLYASSNPKYSGYGQEELYNSTATPYISYLTSGVTGEPIGLAKSHELNLLNIVYQERTTSKNVGDASPISRSTFYYYDNDWNDIIELGTIRVEFDDPAYCSPDNPGGGGGGGGGGIPRCNRITYKTGDEVPFGMTIYQSVGTSSVYYECPCSYYLPNYTTIASNCDFDGSNEMERAPQIHNLKKAFLLKDVYTQIDTLINEEYFSSLGSIPFPSSIGLMEFKQDGVTPLFNEPIFKPLYPFDVLKVKEVKERNGYTQVQLEANEKGLLTRYWYSYVGYAAFINIACRNPDGSWSSTNGNYSGVFAGNLGVPIAITVGYGRPDSLRTEYEYYPDYSVKQITDPNGIQLSYKYDEYGRLKESYRNNELLSVNKYSTWNNDVNLSFLDRTLSNYVETYQLKDKGSNGALQSRKYIDPLGRDFHTMSAEIPDYTGTATINWRYNKIVHTGAIVYDNWNRAIETYKPFVDGDGFSPLTWSYVPNSLTNPTTDAGLYPNISSFASYENDQRSRVLREAKPGEVLNTAHNVKYTYSMANYVCGGCELELSASESNLILGSNPTNVRFKVVEVEDEDGKVSKEYFNALGQKVATKQFIGLQEAITLFIYDSYGNLTKVINPNKQVSTYSYNMMGWLFQKETVDGGVTKYMFNESGQVVLEQDANARTSTNCDDNSEQPYYREYEYDIFGRLTSQSKKYYQLASPDISLNIHVPMLYANSLFNISVGTNPTIGQDLFHNGQYYYGGSSSYLYKFTNNSTYSWKAKSYFFTDNQLRPISNFQVVHNLTPRYEKQLYYGDPLVLSANYHNTTNDILTNNRRNMKGNLSHVTTYGNPYCAKNSKIVKYDFYSYNNNGNLDWQIQQFNANGIAPANKGLVARIDYPNYDLNNNLLVENVDINNDLELDMQYNYTYDYRNRIREVRVSLADEAENGQLLASYDYNNATGLVTKTNYNKDCLSDENKVITNIEYLYDVRDRLTNINSDRFFNYNLYYDNNMPSTTFGPMGTIANFNGNINGTKATYSLTGMHGYNLGDNFDKPTSYAYKYDGINRLTAADAFWNENNQATSLNHAAAKHGDASYTYDKIGNLTTISRFTDASGVNNIWYYQYQQGNNKLMKWIPLVPSLTPRNYTYDAAGNLLTDDYRKVDQSIYGRANLPFDLALKGTQATQYLYDASDARVFKGVYSFNGNFSLGITDNTLGVVDVAEFYLRDAAGNTIGILDYNTGNWTWYAFGRERFAKITPEPTQQPLFFAKDNNSLSESISQNANRDLFIAEVMNVLESDASVQTQLLNIQCKDSTCFWISENNLSGFTDTVPETDYTIVQEYNLKNTNQLVSIDKELISVGVLADISRAKSDSVVSLPDTTTNTMFDEQGRMVREPKFIYTYHTSTRLDDISYYMHDHLGNTRVVFKPNMIDPSVIVNENFDDALKFSNEVNDEFLGSSPCTACANWKGYNSLITNVSYDNGRIRCEENPNYRNIYYGLTMPFPTDNLKTYKVSFDYDGDGSQVSSYGAAIRVEISNGTVGNGSQIVGFFTSDTHVEFTFQAQGTLHRLNMLAQNTDPNVYPKHFYIDNVQISEVGATSDCKIEFTLDYAADYYPYGKILREYNPNAEKYLTTHHERDTETGLDYRGARYYDSDVARFLSLDPKATKYPSVSDYSYVLGNPVHFIDPDGRDVKYSGAGSRRSVRQARRRSDSFNQAFKLLKRHEDVFVFNRNQTQDPKIVNGAENTFNHNDVLNSKDGNFQIGKPIFGDTKSTKTDVSILDFRDAPNENIVMNGSDIPLIGTQKEKSTTTNELYSSGTITLQGTSNEQVDNNGYDKVVITAAGQSEPVFEGTLNSFQQGYPVSITKGFNINKDNSNGFGNRSKLKISVFNENAEKKNPNAFGISISIKGN